MPKTRLYIKTQGGDVLMAAIARAEKQPIKALFLDIDGTLLSHKSHRVPKSALDALAMAKRSGILVFAATGRHLLEIAQIPELDSMLFDCLLTLNGQYCVCGGAPVYSNPLCPADVESLVGFLHQHPIPSLILARDHMFITAMNDTVKKVHAANNTELPDIVDIRRALREDIYQICLYLPDDVVPSAVEHLPNSTWVRRLAHSVDIVPKKGGKWHGAQKMLQHFGLSAGQAAAIGDSDNDVDLLAGVGWGVAMGNASPAVKSASEYQTADVDNNGVADAVELLRKLSLELEAAR